MISHFDQKTILVVDDCEPVCELIEILLSRVGCHVLTATNGDDALHHAGTSSIDLLMSNLDMPVMRGDELARRFSIIHPTIPVLILTSFNLTSEISASFDFLIKPFTVSELRDHVSRALRGEAGSRKMASAA